MKNIDTSPNRETLLTNSEINAIAKTGEINQSGGDPMPPGLASKMDATLPPPSARPGSRRNLEGWRTKSIDQGAQMMNGVPKIAMRRAFLSSKTVFVKPPLLKATTSKIARINCQIKITRNAIGEKAKTRDIKKAIRQVLRHPRSSRASRPSSDLTIHGPITANMIVPNLPEFKDPITTGAIE